MKLGNLHITWRTSQKRLEDKVYLMEFLRSEEVRFAVARVARGEIKNYLAEVAESASVPFNGPHDLFVSLHRVKELLESSPSAFANSERSDFLDIPRQAGQ